MKNKGGDQMEFLMKRKEARKLRMKRNTKFETKLKQLMKVENK